jgi:hypothetical protein
MQYLNKEEQTMAGKVTMKENPKKFFEQRGKEFADQLRAGNENDLTLIDIKLNNKDLAEEIYRYLNIKWAGLGNVAVVFIQEILDKNIQYNKK